MPAHCALCTPFPTHTDLCVTTTHWNKACVYAKCFLLLCLLFPLSTKVKDMRLIPLSWKREKYIAAVMGKDKCLTNVGNNWMFWGFCGGEHCVARLDRKCVETVLQWSSIGKCYHTWTGIRLNPTWMYLESKDAMRTPPIGAWKWAPTLYVCALVPTSL